MVINLLYILTGDYSWFLTILIKDRKQKAPVILSSYYVLSGKTLRATVFTCLESCRWRSDFDTCLFLSFKLDSEACLVFSMCSPWALRRETVSGLSEKTVVSRCPWESLCSKSKFSSSYSAYSDTPTQQDIGSIFHTSGKNKVHINLWNMFCTHTCT